MEAFYIKADCRNLTTLELEDIFEYAISNADILKNRIQALEDSEVTIYRNKVV